MTSILVVDDDEQLRWALERELSAEGHEVSAVSNVAAALEALRERAPEVLITDLRMSEQDGIDLLTELPRVAGSTRPILMSAYATAADHDRATELGAVRVLCKPFTPVELREAIAQAVECESGFRGSVHGLSLVDLLQMFHFGQRSVTLAVGGAATAGRIHLQAGEVVHAEAGERRGEEALRALLAAGTGSLRTGPPEGCPRTIRRPFDSLLLELLRQLDEGERAEVDVDAAFDVAFDEANWLGLDGAGDSAPAVDPDRSSSGGETMGKIDDACKTAVEKVDGSVACGVVDLDTGMLLGIHNSAQYTQTLNEVVAGATMDMFRGPNVGRIEQMVRAHRGMEEDGAHYFEEIHVTSRHNYHFMKTIRGGKAVIVLVTKKSTNIGMGWASLKSVIPEIEPHVP
ncbi:MAG TPA: response regulator [Sandaracinaceae bacterium LLY-WYZ-13_1]|nr:response regulator [Sandaracinaceae bacterium LLY-WYZ-13_1]